MVEVIFKIWWMIAILPFLIFIEGSKLIGKFLKEKDIYHHWDILHAILATAIIVLIFMLLNGYK